MCWMFFFGPCTGHCPLRHALGPAPVRKKTNSLHGPGPGHMVCLTWTKALSNVYASNRELEVVDWIAEQAFLCPTRSAGLVQIFPEEFGGQILHAPTSLWALQKFQLLEGVNKAQRGGWFLCQLVGADQLCVLCSIAQIFTAPQGQSQHWVLFLLKIRYFFFQSVWPILEGKLWAEPEETLENSWNYVDVGQFSAGEMFWVPSKIRTVQVGIV